MQVSCPNCPWKGKAVERPVDRLVLCPKCKKRFTAKAVVIQPVQIPPVQIQTVHNLFVVPPPLISKQSPLALPYIRPTELQVGGENLVLYATLGVAMLLLMLASVSTMMIFVVVLAIVYSNVLSDQKRFRTSATEIDLQSNPKLFRMVETAARRLTVPTPEVFVLDNQTVNAFATGHDRAGMVVLHSRLVELMNDDELMFIIGHELTHIKCGHCKYTTLTNATTQSILNRGISTVASLVFLVWSRKSEFTCDRGGVIACKNPTAAITALGKFEFEDPAKRDSFVQKAMNANGTSDSFVSTHPETVNRIRSVWEYAHEPDYSRLSALQS